jgi:hypothetical protein
VARRERDQKLMTLTIASRTGRMNEAGDRLHAATTAVERGGVEVTASTRRLSSPIRRHCRAASA